MRSPGRRHPGILCFTLIVSLALLGISTPSWADASSHEEKSRDQARGALQLVSQSEINALSGDHPVSLIRKPVSPDGPRIEIESPTHNGIYRGPFPIKVAFLPGPKGDAVNFDTLRLEYKRAWGIDITDRVREYLQNGVIDVGESELPRGRHTVEIEIADVENRTSRRTFSVVIE